MQHLQYLMLLVKVDLISNYSMRPNKKKIHCRSLAISF